MSNYQKESVIVNFNSSEYSIPHSRFDDLFVNVESYKYIGIEKCFKVYYNEAHNMYHIKIKKNVKPTHELTSKIRSILQDENRNHDYSEYDSDEEEKEKDKNSDDTCNMLISLLLKLTTKMFKLLPNKKYLSIHYVSSDEESEEESVEQSEIDDEQVKEVKKVKKDK